MVCLFFLPQADGFYWWNIWWKIGIGLAIFFTKSWRFDISKGIWNTHFNPKQKSSTRNAQMFLPR
jgi:hypothetical protein